MNKARRKALDEVISKIEEAKELLENLQAEEEEYRDICGASRTATPMRSSPALWTSPLSMAPKSMAPVSARWPRSPWMSSASIEAAWKSSTWI